MELFTKRKKNSKQMEQILSCLAGISLQLKSLEERVQSMGTAVEDSRKEINLQRMSLEDNIEMLEEMKDSLEIDREERKEKAEKEENGIDNMLRLIEAYEENLWNMGQYAKQSDSSFYQNFCLMKDNLEGYKKELKIEIIYGKDGKVDYEKHDVLQVIPTMVEEQDKMIANVYSPGIVYGGKIRKKAKVAVYRFPVS